MFQGKSGKPFRLFSRRGSIFSRRSGSGLTLQKNFPNLADDVIPVLRKAEVKYEKQTQSDIRAKGAMSVDEKEKFLHQLENKGRGIITGHLENFPFGVCAYLVQDLRYEKNYILGGKRTCETPIIRYKPAVKFSSRLDFERKI